MDDIDFLKTVNSDGLRAVDRAVAMLWWISRTDFAAQATTKEICDAIEAAGHPRQNRTRLRAALRADRRATKVGQDAWKLHANARPKLTEAYNFAALPKAPVDSDSVLPRDLFAGTRGYLVKVVEQINRSYDTQLWDCCAVMARRLIETLIIELYEKLGRADEIKDDGNFVMLNGLIAFLEADKSVHFGRNAAKGLKDFKQLGDLSAHNRRFNAKQSDIDRVRDGLRVASEELLHLAEIHPDGGK